MTEQVEVRVRDCECPGHPHNGVGDVVFMRSKPSVALGLAVEADVVAAAQNGDALRRNWIISYITYGVTGWNLLDKKGEKLPFDVQVLLDDYDMGMLIAEKADELYGDRVINPLVRTLLARLGLGPMADSTSPPQEPTPSPPPPSSPDTSEATAPEASTP